jgi:L-cysteine S-thiosulfotransferase
MNRFAILLLTAASLLGDEASAQDPASDRQKIEAWLTSKYPTLTVADYARGELAFGEAGPLLPDAAVRAAVLARGKLAWERKFRNGRNIASCFPNGGKRVAATYPQLDTRSSQVVTFESAINRCLKQHRQSELDFARNREAGEMLVYARSLSEGIATNVRVNGKAAQAQYAAGRELFFSRIGSRNQACASCHVQFAGQVMLDRVLTAAIGQTSRWPRVNADGKIVTLQEQYQICFRRSGAEAPDWGSPALNNLEYFHTGLSNGLRPSSSLR